MPPPEFKELYFPMLKLPDLMIQRAIRKLSASDVFHFSLISPEHLKCIKSTTGHALASAEIELVVKGPEEMEIEFTPVDSNVTVFTISVRNIKQAAPDTVKNDDFDQEINGFPMKIRLYMDRTTTYVPSGFRSKIALIKYCFENLQCQGISLRFEYCGRQMIVCRPIVNAFKQCQDFRIQPSATQSNYNMERFLSGIQVWRLFKLCHHSMQPLNLPASVFNAKKLCISAKIVMTREMLLSLNCEYAAFYSSDLTSEDLSAFVVKWFNSDGSHFKSLQVRNATQIRPLDLSSIPEQNIEQIDNDNTKVVRADGTFAVVTLVVADHTFDFKVFNEEVEF